MSTPNFYRDRAQRIKASRLVAAIDRRLTQAHVTDWSHVAMAIDDWSDEEWAVCAKEAGCNPPRSDYTRHLVADAFRGRCTDVDPFARLGVS